MFVRCILLFLCAIFTVGVDLAVAAGEQQQTVLRPTKAAPPARVLGGAHGYTYIGCWNETVGFESNGGARALAGGKESARNDMTIATCLKYCSTGNSGHNMQYAGLEYGRQCWCGAHLSELSAKLNESSRCIYSCKGNSSEICGGRLALTLYNLTSAQAQTGIAWSQFSGAAGYGTLAVVMLILAALM